MGEYFLESSAFAKRYKEEKGSDFINRLFLENHKLFYLNLTILEIQKIFYRLYKYPQKGEPKITQHEFEALTSRFADDLLKMHKINFTDEMIGRAIGIFEKVWIRSIFDLAQLSGFLIAKEEYPDLIFVCSDVKLAEAAKIFIKESEIIIPELIL